MSRGDATLQLRLMENGQPSCFHVDCKIVTTIAVTSTNPLLIFTGRCQPAPQSLANPTPALSLPFKMCALWWAGIVLSLFIISPHGLASDTITWQTIHVPPSSIRSGPLEGKGFAQLILKQITANMPEYEHTYPVTTLARTAEDIKAGKNVCHPTLLQNADRKNWMTFSQASLFNPNNQLIMTQSLATKVGENPVILEQLNQQADLLYAIIRQRAYGEIIDHYLGEYVDREQRLMITSDNLSNVFRLVAIGKVDVTIAFPFEYYYFTENKPEYRQNLALRPIANQPQFIVGHVACAKTPWGEAVIERVDRVLNKLKPTVAYKKAMTKWWPKETLTPEFERFYHQYFLTH